MTLFSDSVALLLVSLLAVVLLAKKFSLVVDAATAAIGAPVAGAYVRLLNDTDEFTAEVVASATGDFRFFAAPGTWTLVTLVPGATQRTPVGASLGSITDLDVLVD